MADCGDDTSVCLVAPLHEHIHKYVQVHVTRLFTYLRILAASGAPPSLQVLKRVGQEAEAHGIKYWTGALASMSAGTYQVSGAK